MLPTPSERTLLEIFIISLLVHVVVCTVYVMSTIQQYSAAFDWVAGHKVLAFLFSKVEV